MSNINLQEGKINFEGEWLSTQDMSNKIRGKMDAGDMKFSSLAEALEELNTALENSHKIETRIVILKEQYKKLKALGGSDDQECVLKAIKVFIGGGIQKEQAPKVAPIPATESKEKKIIKCKRCNADIEIDISGEEKRIQCPVCKAIGHQV